MSMMEVRLFELSCKGDRLDEINAEAVFNQQAKAAERRQAFRKLIKRLIAALRGKRTTAGVQPGAVVLSPQR
ncbi:MAG: hypothetical protein R3E79_40425 [Caldilineaceae bacterium]